MIFFFCNPCNIIPTVKRFLVAVLISIFVLTFIYLSPLTSEHALFFRWRMFLSRRTFVSLSCLVAMMSAQQHDRKDSLLGTRPGPLTTNPPRMELDTHQTRPAPPTSLSLASLLRNPRLHGGQASRNSTSRNLVML